MSVECGTPDIFVPEVSELIDGKGIDQRKMTFRCTKYQRRYTSVVQQDPKRFDAVVMQRVRDYFGDVREIQKLRRKHGELLDDLLQELQGEGSEEQAAYLAECRTLLPTLIQGGCLTEIAIEVYKELHEFLPNGDWWMDGRIRKNRSGNNVAASFKVASDPPCTIDFLWRPQAFRLTTMAYAKGQGAPISKTFKLPEDIKPSTLIPKLDRAGYEMQFLVFDTMRAIFLLEKGCPVVY